MQNCSNLYFLTTLAYQLTDCLSDDGTYNIGRKSGCDGDLLANIGARNDFKSQL